ncbi:asparagine synthase (glutamine-hydrolysing) [Lutibacter sp. Hel_I_33_5]|uniref:asparagine synthase (glutamine-hydrolyzing) n=1 Tax=Lutibacter sp. Hel_I_33_5 TaxID=1566289 RepID=UPI00119F7A32|nr:asparagine synthase (glutamine-hydrolyzing) [Lutibacter sp. Hel_I_33_5]TVZ54863.1 asparagine synthase (glutamine-hydrolysing) [Lutibacter sp. Hel_I_33_5]
MCGIVGIIGEKANINTLKSMLKVQQHRGPDFTGIFQNKNIVLGHNRLSIIDLSEIANQPFISSNKRYTLVFNGEIYNYLELKNELITYNFVTNSDTEVLLAAYIKWGKKCLSKLNGMFSFAIWDSQKEVLFAARDRFGVKPFYYHKTDSTFYFSSEIKTLHETEIEKAPSEKAWANYLVYGSYGMPNETFWENILQLPGGYFLTYVKGKLSSEKWYFFEKEVLKHQKNESIKKVKSTYKKLLKESIKLRFRADVKIGFNISGGLDSSILLAFVNQINTKQNIKAYTFCTNDERYDELPWVKQMISLTNNPLSEVILEPNKEIEDKIKYVSDIQDEPFGGIPTVAYSQIFKQARKEGTIVLLDGQGMDEQWAGYDYYTQQGDATIQGVRKSPFRTNVLRTGFLKLAEKPVYPKPFNNRILDMQYRDLFYTKIPRALRFNDRISMAYSTELREPFLDYRLVEFAFAQPLKYKINKRVQKYLLRELASEYLGNTITYAPKRPLQTPQREWLGGELKKFVTDNLDKLKSSEYSKWFNSMELDKEWELYLAGNNDASFHIWQWVNLSLILR